VLRFPITSYKEDPDQNRRAEYHEVNYSLDGKAGGFVLLDMHGWWENVMGTQRLKRQMLCEPHTSKEHASAAMDERVRGLEEEGWTFKFTKVSDPATGALRPKRI